MTQSKPSETTINLDELDITLDLSSNDVITIDTNTMNDYAYTLTSDTIDLSGIITDVNSDIDIDWNTIGNLTLDRVVFEDYMPDAQNLKKMCEEYPALEKAYENFKTIYKMVHQDWRGKQDDDEELPF